MTAQDAISCKQRGIAGIMEKENKRGSEWTMERLCAGEKHAAHPAEPFLSGNF